MCKMQNAKGKRAIPVGGTRLRVGAMAIHNVGRSVLRRRKKWALRRIGAYYVIRAIAYWVELLCSNYEQHRPSGRNGCGEGVEGAFGDHAQGV
jgi:hypothetical protein